MWIEGLHDKVTWVMFNGCREPRLKLEHSPVYPGMTAGVCCTALSSSIITAPLPFEPEDKQPRSKSFQTICQRMEFVTSFDNRMIYRSQD